MILWEQKKECKQCMCALSVPQKEYLSEPMGREEGEVDLTVKLNLYTHFLMTQTPC